MNFSGAWGISTFWKKMYMTYNTVLTITHCCWRTHSIECYLDTLLIATQLDLHLFWSSTYSHFFTGFVLFILQILIMYVPSWIALLVNALCNGLVVFNILDPHNVCALPSLVCSLVVHENIGLLVLCHELCVKRTRRWRRRIHIYPWQKFNILNIKL